MGISSKFLKQQIGNLSGRAQKLFLQNVLNILMSNLRKMQKPLHNLYFPFFFEMLGAQVEELFLLKLTFNKFFFIETKDVVGRQSQDYKWSITLIHLSTTHLPSTKEIDIKNMSTDSTLRAQFTSFPTKILVKAKKPEEFLLQALSTHKRFRKSVDFHFFSEL
jgi:hypothetical protein